MIYQTGDSCTHEQLNPKKHVNIWINHPRVGLDAVRGAEKIKPDWVFFSHLLEMGHCQPSPYRPVSFKELQDRDIPGCTKLGVRCAIPLLGEKIVWTSEK